MSSLLDEDDVAGECRPPPECCAARHAPERSWLVPPLAHRCHGLLACRPWRATCEGRTS